MTIVVVIAFLLCIGTISAQESRHPANSVSIDYLKAANKSATLYYGIEYEGYAQVKNPPYLTKSPCLKSSLSYRGVMYPEVCLRLDLWKDELAVFSPDLRYFILFPEDVEFAELMDKHLIYHKRDAFPNSPATGYYFLLYDSDYKVLEKQYATFVQKDKTIRTTWTVMDFSIKTRYYLFKDGVYHPIKNKNTLLKTLYPYKKELKQFISSQRLSFRRDAAELLIQATGEYEKLVNNPTIN